MNTSWRRVVATAMVAGSMISGCAVIISSDDHDNYDDEDCGRCHDTLTIVIPKTNTTAVEQIVPRSEDTP